MSPKELFNELVYTKFILYNSLFSNLPFKDIREISTYLPVFSQACETGLQEGKSPADIVNDFVKDHKLSTAVDDPNNLLFKFIQFIERQVVLFDGLEDAAYGQLNDPKGSGTLTELFALARSQHKEAELAKQIKEFKLRLVLTAHPTQFYNNHVLGIITDLTEGFRENDLSKVNQLLLQLSKTPFFKKDKPTPFQEAERLSWYLQHIFYDAMTEVSAKLTRFLEEHKAGPDEHIPVEIGFWPGGDRDGNPFVTHETTLQTANLMRQSILACYRRDAKLLRRKLTFKKVDQMIEAINTKLYAAIYGEKHPYRSPEELEKDLREILQVIDRENEGIYANEIKALLSKIRLFGFHFAGIDVRQGSDIHQSAVEEIMDKAGLLKQYHKADMAGKLDLLLKTSSVKKGSYSPMTQEVLDTINTIKTIQKQNGEQALNRYIISNCHHAADVAGVLFLFRAAGWKGKLPVDIIPLFETVDDLQRADETMQALYAHQQYKSHVENRGKRQVVMVGFSDGTKDGGYLTANWEIYKAKQQLTRVAEAHGIRIVFFDGRGGPAARGGGNTHRFYASMDESIAKSEIQLTIQGQTISSNYGTFQSASYNMEQMLHAGLGGEVLHSGENALTENQSALINELSEYSYKAYTKLKQDPLFLGYLERFSPIRLLGMANIASRPTSRGSAKKLRYEDLRAITFVGAWYQIKQNVPGFYGLGTALEKLRKKNRLHEAKKLYQESPFFSALVDNSMMALTKTNLSITAYIAKDRKYGRLWKHIRDEHDVSVALLLEITGRKTLMGNQPAGEKSVAMREELVMPLAIIQQYALNRLNKTRSEKMKSLYKNMVVRTLYGMTNAGRNSV